MTLETPAGLSQVVTPGSICVHFLLALCKKQETFPLTEDPWGLFSIEYRWRISEIVIYRTNNSIDRSRLTAKAILFKVNGEYISLACVITGPKAQNPKISQSPPH